MTDFEDDQNVHSPNLTQSDISAVERMMSEIPADIFQTATDLVCKNGRISFDSFQDETDHIWAIARAIFKARKG